MAWRVLVCIRAPCRCSERAQVRAERLAPTAYGSGSGVVLGWVRVGPPRLRIATNVLRIVSRNSSWRRNREGSLSKGKKSSPRVPRTRHHGSSGAVVRRVPERRGADCCYIAVAARSRCSSTRAGPRWLAGDGGHGEPGVRRRLHRHVAHLRIRAGTSHRPLRLAFRVRGSAGMGMGAHRRACACRRPRPAPRWRRVVQARHRGRLASARCCPCCPYRAQT